MSNGIISPESSMEGRKISCDHSSVARELDDTTPIRTPSPANATRDARVTTTNQPQSDGAGAPNSGVAETTMMTVTTITCSEVVSIGALTMLMAGTPPILKLRKMPASRALTSGSGSPISVPIIAAKITMAGIMFAVNIGLICVMTNPIMA